MLDHPGEGVVAKMRNGGGGGSLIGDRHLSIVGDNLQIVNDFQFAPWRTAHASRADPLRCLRWFPLPRWSQLYRVALVAERGQGHRLLHRAADMPAGQRGVEEAVETGEQDLP